MKENQLLEKMVPPSQKRAGKPMGGVIQIHVTRACDKACFHCTQGSNLAGKNVYITPEQFEAACKSVSTYWGIVGMFGGNPAMHPKFEELCEIMRTYIPFLQRGLWCNNPLTPSKTRAMAATFNPAVSNLNCHLDYSAFDMFKQYWPKSRPFGHGQDSRHSPTMVALKDKIKMRCPNCWDERDMGVELCSTCNGTGSVYDEEHANDLISNCDINQHWSALIGVVPNYGLRGFFCEVAYAQAALHAEDPDEVWPDTGVPINEDGISTWTYRLPGGEVDTKVGLWWQLPMVAFRDQVRQHCHNCGVPMRLFGQLAVKGSYEEVSETHKGIYKPKDKSRRVELITLFSPPERQLDLMTDYLGNSRR